eukprot:jgi/Chrzof1/12475/Cz06g35200.t1
MTTPLSCWELAIQLRRDVLPVLDEQGVKLYLVSIGTWERSKQFVEVTDFPPERLLVDPDNVTYTALGLAKGVMKTFFSAETAFSFKRRFEKGQLSDLKDVMGRWKPWTPPRTDQALQQGGMFVFDGNKCVWSHYDKGTGSHADLSEVLGKVGKLVEATSNAATAMPDCGDSACDIPK